ncbi:MAG: DUF1294 domain-containing protein [Oscillospiraceae bacterium]|nr:DUF1294 domain-containing protein [Oscillospiraceae bacterium]
MSVPEYLWQHPIWILVIYLVIINLVLFATMAVDKQKAKRDKRRVPEATLFLMALIGGSIGGIAGMYCFRHKTKHMSFVIGFPAILILELALVIFILVKF